MRVLIDSNVLISAALNPNGTPFKAFLKAVTAPNQGVNCEQNIDEMRRIFNRKFPTKIPALESFLALALLTMELIPVPTEEQESETLIRDADDRPLLRAAIAAGVDAFITGDNDFLSAKLERPKILTCTEFLSGFWIGMAG